MAIAFSAKWIDAIKSGDKTVTFRKWPKVRVKVGGVYDAATIAFPPKVFARLKVTGASQIAIADIGDDLARQDGAKSAEEVKAYWRKQGFDAKKKLWLVKFEVTK